jgi:hypothetical protein
MTSSMFRSFPARALLLFVASAILGPLGDLCHVLSGTDAYSPGGALLPLLPMPVWVPPLMGSGGMIIGLTHPLADRLLAGMTGAKVPARPGIESWARIGWGLLAFLMIYCSSGFLSLPTGGTRDLLLGAAALSLWWEMDRTWQGLVYGALTGALGSLAEMNLVTTGKFLYLPGSANFFGVPSWLPWLYFSCSVAVGNLGRMLVAPTATASARGRTAQASPSP